MTLWAEEMQDMDSLSFKGHMGRVEAVWDSRDDQRNKLQAGRWSQKSLSIAGPQFPWMKARRYTDLTGPFQLKADTVAVPSGSYNPSHFWPCHHQGPTGKSSLVVWNM